ncbi:MAG: FCD domain-containing protein, partial [Cognatishimia sp.]|nr:FCD domain-containing protein [Cognatishimia sp.]
RNHHTDGSEANDALTIKLDQSDEAAQRRAAEAHYSQPDLKALAAAIENMELALESNDLENWVKSDDLFHRELVRLGQNSRAFSVFEMMNDQVRRARSVTLFMRPLPVQSNEDHRQLYEAIANGDATRAVEIHRDHRQNAKHMMLDLLSKHRLNSV